MAREIVVELNGQPSRFAFAKVDRKKLYGSRKRLPLDPSGATCTKGELTADSGQLIRPGMTAQGYFDPEGYWFASKDLKGMHADGTEATHHPSTLGAVQTLNKIDAHVLLNARVESVYALKPEDLNPDLQIELEAGSIYSFPFNYRAGYAPQTGFLVANATGMYALIGRLTTPEWCSLDVAPVETFADDEDDFDDDLDFEMF